MSKLQQLNVGVVGVLGRGQSFIYGFIDNKDARIHAICDLDADLLSGAMEKWSASEKYTSYEEMLVKSELDAVIIATPMHLHVPQSIMALEEGLHVLSEVPAGVTIDECRMLVKECNRSTGKYMMGENCVFMRENMLIEELVDRGMFGELYYAEGEYLHELKQFNERTAWRRKWLTGINGITYATHSLGPILMWMKNDRISRVSCVGSGRHYSDTNGNPYQQEDTCVMLGKTEMDRLIKIRVDMLSNRPEAPTNYFLQGVKGCYESARSVREKHKIWLMDICDDINDWRDLAEFEDEYLVDMWRNIPEAAKQSTHWGADYFEVKEFIECLTENKPFKVGIHEAMDMTLPGLVSQQSILKHGEWLDVPDSREW